MLFEMPRKSLAAPCKRRCGRVPDRLAAAQMRRGLARPRLLATRRQRPSRPAERSRIAHTYRDRTLAGPSVDGDPFEEHRRTRGWKAIWAMSAEGTRCEKSRHLTER